MVHSKLDTASRRHDMFQMEAARKGYMLRGNQQVLDDHQHRRPFASSMDLARQDRRRSQSEWMDDAGLVCCLPCTTYSFGTCLSLRRSIGVIGPSLLLWAAQTQGPSPLTHASVPSLAVTAPDGQVPVRRSFCFKSHDLSWSCCTSRAYKRSCSPFVL